MAFQVKWPEPSKSWKVARFEKKLRKFTLDVRRSDNVEELRNSRSHFCMRLCLTKACKQYKEGRNVVLLYGHKNWTTNAAFSRSIETSEFAFFRGASPKLDPTVHTELHTLNRCTWRRSELEWFSHLLLLMLQMRWTSLFMNCELTDFGMLVTWWGGLTMTNKNPCVVLTEHFDPPWWLWVWWLND